MQREILFRGKTVDNREWVFGYYYQYSGRHIICWQEHSDDITTDHFAGVIPETVGQFIGLTDINGIKIFIGDYLQDEYMMAGDLRSALFPVIWCDKMLQYCVDVSSLEGEPIPCPFLEYFDESQLKVNGNIHETT